MIDCVQVICVLQFPTVTAQHRAFRYLLFASPSIWCLSVLYILGGCFVKYRVLYALVWSLYWFDGYRDRLAQGAIILAITTHLPSDMRR